MSLKKQAISGVKWNFIQQLSVQAINFAVQIVLARLLMPEMFGLIAMVIVFVSIGASLMDSGMTSSIIRTKEPDQIDYSTVFVTNVIVSFAIYILIYMSAPYIAGFYNQDALVDIIRLLSFSFVIRAFVAVHVAKLTKEMNFKLQMQLQIPASIISGVVGIVMAYKGYGVWSLVWMNLVQAFVFAIQNWIFIPWRPSLVFDKKKFIYHFSFGYKLTLSGLIDTTYNDLYRIVIGKSFSPMQVGYFNHAENLRLFPVSQLSAVLGKVTYPYFSNIEDDASLKKAYRKTIKLTTFVTLPMMLILILVAEEGFRFVFGEKWLPAVPYFQLLALASIIRPVSAYNLNILKVKGRSDLFLLLEVIKKILGVVLLFYFFQFGVSGLVISLLIFSYLSYGLNSLVSGGLISYSLLAQIKDVYVFIIVGSLVYLLLYMVKTEFFLMVSDWAICLLFLTAFMLLYTPVVLYLDKELKNTILNLRK